MPLATLKSVPALAGLLAATAVAGLAILLPAWAAEPARQGSAEQVDAHTYDVRGWAVSTRGGQGGRILRVTNLDASGPGSYRAAVEAEGPRIVVFEVGGVIDMDGRNIEIKHPHLTIAGQTAPSPGITLVKAETVISAHNVIVQHLRFRPGEFGRAKKSGKDQDGLSTVGGAHDVIVDHCSFSWATDENLSASGPRFAGATPEQWRAGTSHDITYSHNLIYEGLSHSVHEKGEHSKGSLIHDNTSGILLYRNVYASNRERNALFKGGARGAMVNNMIFNPGTRAVHYNLHAAEWGSQPFQTGRVSLVANHYRQGPNTAPQATLFLLGGQGDVELALQDNIAQDRNGQPIAQIGTMPNSKARIVALGAPDLPADVKPMPAARLADALPPTVGARPWDRDELDALLLRDMAAGRGRIIDSEVENALGYPRHKPSSRPFVAELWNLDDMSPKAGWSSIAALTLP